MNLPELAEASFVRLGERKVLEFEKKEFTNIEFLNQSRCLHQSLKKLGVKKGDVVSMCLITDPLVFPVFQGIFRTGGIAIPVMFALTAHELNYIFSDSKTKGIVTDLFSIDKIREAIKDLDNIEWIAVLGGEDNKEGSVPEYRLETLFENGQETELPAIGEDETALILYTAGTTGKSKGVMLSHRNLINTAEASLDAAEPHLKKNPRINVSALPLAHIFGVSVMNGSYIIPEHLAAGYTVQMQWFDPEKFMQLIEEYKASFTTVVPTMLAMILNHPKINDYDLTSLSEVVCGAAPLPVEHERAFSKLVDIDYVRGVYGCTESCGLGTASRPSGKLKPGSVGQVYSGMKLKIVDNDGKEMPTGQRGEVLIKGPSVMKGYLNRQEETDNVIKDGWLYTGDIGYLDEEGYLFIVDRKKDLIIKGGENIYPGERISKCFFAFCQETAKHLL